MFAVVTIKVFLFSARASYTAVITPKFKHNPSDSFLYRIVEFNVRDYLEKNLLKTFSDIKMTSVKSRAYVTKITTEEDLTESAAMINHGHGGSVKNLINQYESKINGEALC